MSDVIDYYNGFLDSTNNPRDEHGVVLYESNTGDLKPVMIDGKKLILPTKEFQKKPDWTQFVAFHPLSESIARGESEVLMKARTLIGLRLFYKYIELSEALLLLAVDSAAQSKLTPSTMKLLEGLGDADAKTVENFSKIIAKAKVNFDGGENRCLISLFLKRGGTMNGAKFARLCVASFPYYEALQKIEDESAEKRQVFGVPLRAKDIKVLKRLHEVILPNSDDGVYSIGTNSQTAPYWGALMMTYVNLLNQFNSLVKPFSKVIKSLKTINTDWDVGDELQKFRNQIPPMPYNEGADATTPPPEAQAPAVQQQVPQPQQQLMQQPVAVPQQQQVPQMQQQPQYNPAPAVHPTPAPVNHTKTSNAAGISFGDALSKSPVAMAMPQMQMFPQQQMMPQMPMYPQMQMQMPMPQVPGQQQMPQMMLPYGQMPMPPVGGQQQPQQMYQQPQYPQYQQPQMQMYPQQMPGMQQMYPQQQMMQPQMMQPGMFQFQR